MQQISPYTFLGGCVQNRNIGRVIARFDEFAADGSNACNLMMWTRKNGQWHHFNLGWTALSLVTTQARMFALGPNGQVLVADISGTREERIRGADEASAGDITALRIVHGDLWAVGAGPVAFRRDGENCWTAFREGLSSGACDPNQSLVAVDGCDGSDIWAVGTAGAIWRLADASWRTVDSPTQNTLGALRVVEPGLIYAAGQSGTLLRGDDQGRFTAIASGSTEDDIAGLELFQDRLYVATAKALFTLGRGDRLEPVQGIRGLPSSFGKLDARDGVLWSFGLKRVLWTEDGSEWHDVTPGAVAVDTTQSDDHHGEGCSCDAHRSEPQNAVPGALHVGGGGHKVD